MFAVIVAACPPHGQDGCANYYVDPVEFAGAVVVDRPHQAQLADIEALAAVIRLPPGDYAHASLPHRE